MFLQYTHYFVEEPLKIKRKSVQYSTELTVHQIILKTNTITPLWIILFCEQLIIFFNKSI